MKSYTFTLVIREGDDEFWEHIQELGVTGCEELKIEIENALFGVGFDIDGTHNLLYLTRFEDDANVSIS